MKTATIAAILLVLALPTSRPALAQRFTQTNLVSDQSGVALRTDANLVNPWGLAPSAGGVFWTSNEATGTSSLIDPDGTVRSLVVTVPGGSPTGIVATASTDSAFDVPNGATTARAAFIFVTLNGTIAAWNPTVNQTNAIQVSSDPGAVYTGAALGGTPTNPLLYVANFAGGSIEVYDSSFAETTLAGSFTDPNLPSGYYPFNIANIGGQLYVAYAQRSASGEEQPGGGLGVVSVFDLQGNFVRRFATSAELNAPWAIVQAPAGFGSFGGNILVGNFGDGRILVYDTNGVYQGALEDSVGHQIEIEGLWGLAFGRPASGTEVANRLYFAAGIDDENHGLFGYIAVADSDSTGEPPVAACDNESKGAGHWRNLCGGPVNSGHGPGDDHPGNGNGNGSDNGRGRDARNEHRPGGANPDSLDALFACIANDAAPNAFGSNGCYTAGCDLMRKVGWRTEGERAAQVLLLTRLNLCSGAVCDSFAITCVDDGDSVDVLTVGEVADSLDILLCENGSSSDIRRMVGALRCVIDDEDGDDEHGDDDDARANLTQKIAVRTLGLSPVRLGAGPVQFAVNTTTPSLVQLRIYDVRGRLVAQPMSNTMVVGSASVSWNGTDSHGKAVPSGTYFYRAITAGEAATGRLLIVR